MLKKLLSDLYLNFNTGTVAWLFHRISGLALVFYLCLHTFAIGTSQYGSGPFDATLGFLQSPFFKFLEVALIAAVFYHLLNGLRLVFIEITLLTRSHKIIWWGIMIVFAAAMVFTGYMVLGKLLHGAIGAP
jgi:succinate dehydrogenase / fumarate reductase cytochrome b subunit